jgi:REP element-mobilizing transposase RayT
MSRKGREKSGTGIYHVMLRGINRQDIFEDAEDYMSFTKILAAVQDRLEDDLITKTTTCHIYAYCLMPNHVHLLLCEKNWQVGDVMKSIASSYVFYYNKKYGRIGHLFQDRFRSEPCNTPEYFFTLFRYIHQNPVKAGLVKLAQDYPYSSWPNDYLSLGQERVCFTRAAVKRFGLDELAVWVDDPLPENVGCIDMDERKVVADELVRDPDRCHASPDYPTELFSISNQGSWGLVV